MKVIKWSLMSSMMVPVVMVKALLFVSIWSMRVDEPFCMQDALKFVNRNPALVILVMYVLAWWLVSMLRMFMLESRNT